MSSQQNEGEGDKSTGDGKSSRSSRHRKAADDSEKDQQSLPSSSKSTPPAGGAFNTRGLPIVKNIPYQHCQLQTLPGKMCGSYMFEEDLDDHFDKEKYYQKNKKHAWAIVIGTSHKSDPGVFAKTGNCPWRSSNPATYNMPISSLWQSACGRFVLCPKSSYSLPCVESVAKKDWFPSKTWIEYMTKNVADEKYNIRNGKFSIFSSVFNLCFYSFDYSKVFVN
jgi:hypothetical protein